jgi:hypothetical protein
MTRPATILPVSVTPRTAALMLDVSYDHFRKKHLRPGEETFTVLRPYGVGVGKRCYIPTDEIEVYGRTRDVAAVAAFRAEKLNPVAAGA